MRNTQSGGGRNTVPKPGTDLPDIKNAVELQQLMAFYNLAGHGTMSEDKQSVFLVPENTWILFITRAGIVAEKRKSDVLRTALDDFYYLKENETEKQWYERIYKAMEDGTLFKTILYENNAKQKFSIYEPGDLIQDLELQFINNHWPLMRMGIWKCPIPDDVYEKLELMNNMKDVIEFNPQIKEYITELQTYRDKQTFQEAKDRIDKIVKFLLTKHTIPSFEVMKFYDSDDFIKGMKDKEVERIVKNFLNFTQLVQASQKQLDSQYSLFEHPNNLILRSPSVKEGKLNSSLYKILMDKRFGYNKKTLVDENLLETEKYRFIVVDACRSIEHPSMPEILYKPRAALTRSMSNIARREVCVTNLLQMTKNKFEKLIHGKKISDQSAIMKLLQGQSVLLSDFESSIVGKNGSLRNFLEKQQFKQYDPVFVYNGQDGYTGIVVDIDIDEAGRLMYKVIPEVEQNQNLYNEEGRISVPASSVFASERNIQSLVEERIKEQRNAIAESKRLQKQKRENEEKKRKEQEEAAKRAKELEEQRKKENADRETQKKKQKEDREKTFETYATNIQALSSNVRDLIKPGKIVTVNLSHLPDTNIDKIIYHNRKLFVTSVGKSKSLGDKFVVALEPLSLTLGQREEIETKIKALGQKVPEKFLKVFDPQYIKPYVEPAKKGGAHKTRRLKRSKRQTRRN